MFGFFWMHADHDLEPGVLSLSSHDDKPPAVIATAAPHRLLTHLRRAVHSQLQHAYQQKHILGSAYSSHKQSLAHAMERVVVVEESQSQVCQLSAGPVEFLARRHPRLDFVQQMTSTVLLLTYILVVRGHCACQPVVNVT